MKKILFLAVVMILQSCAYTYYQVYEVKSDIQQKENALVYYDENCEIIYNLWSESGTMDFVLTNKTFEDIYVDMSKSFFIVNGLAYDYYKGREYTNSVTTQEASSVGVTNAFYGIASKSASATAYGASLWTPMSVSIAKGVSAGAGIAKSATISKLVGQTSAVKTREEKEVLVPAGASKVVKSFSISDYVYLECDNKDFNQPKKESEKITYAEENSPLNFKNRIVYSVNGKEKRVVNSFYVASVQNIKETTMIKEEYEKDCMTKMEKKKQYMTVSAPNMFYNTYSLQP